MQNIIMVNQPTRAKVVKRFLESRGIKRYAFVKDSDELFQYLLIESSNVHIFDFYLDMPTINTLTAMKDSINTLAVYVPDPKVGEPYLTLTDNISIMPNEVDLLCWFWDTAACNLENVLACKAVGKPFCTVSLPPMNVKPNRIRVDIKSTTVPAKYTLTSGQVRNKKVSQLTVAVKTKGTKIVDKGEVRKQTGIFETTARVIDVPVIAEDNTCSEQMITDKPVRQGFSFSLPTFEHKPKEPKPAKEPKPPKVKPVKEPKPPKEPKPKKVKEPRVKKSKAPELNVPDIPGINPPAINLALPNIELPPKREQPKTYVTPDEFVKNLEEVMPACDDLNTAGDLYAGKEIEQEFGSLTRTKVEVAVEEVPVIPVTEEPTEEPVTEEPLTEPVEEVEPITEPAPEPDIIPAPTPVPAIEDVEVAPTRKRKEFKSIDLPISSEPATSTPKRSPVKLGNLGNSYNSVSDYMFMNKLVGEQDHLSIMKYISENSRPGHLIQYGDVALERGLIDAEDLVAAHAKVFRMEVLTWAQLDTMPVNFDEFDKERCRKLKFFRTEDDFEGNVQIVMSVSSLKMDTTIRRLYDNPRIRYTITQYIDKKLE